MEVNWKKWCIISWGVIILLIVGSGIFGPALLKKYAKTEVVEKIKERVVTRTIRVPVEVAGEVAYREETTTDTAVDNATHATDEKREITQRNIVIIGLGIDQQTNPSLLLSANLLGPLGVAGEATFSIGQQSIKGGHVWACLGL